MTTDVPDMSEIRPLRPLTSRERPSVRVGDQQRPGDRRSGDQAGENEHEHRREAKTFQEGSFQWVGRGRRARHATWL
jgi:hypothetical protein